MRPQLGSLIGAVGGLAFVLANALELPGSVARPVQIAGVVAFIGVILLAVRFRRSPVEGPAPVRDAWRTYLISVAAMVVAIPVGSALLTRVLDHPALVLPWVVLMVGLHFLPFARAFRVRIR